MMDFTEIIKKDRERWNQLSVLCERTGKKQLEVIGEATEFIRRKNEEKYEEMMSNNTPPEIRAAIFWEFFMTDLLLASTGNVNKYSPLRRNR